MSNTISSYTYKKKEKEKKIENNRHGAQTTVVKFQTKVIQKHK
jgi:hypothetical protein